jgi:transposase InsO family protein
VAQGIARVPAQARTARFGIPAGGGLYGAAFIDRVAGFGTEEKLIAPRSPWQSPYVERLIGSIRRECLDHFIILNERHLKAVLAEYLAYYHEARTHQALDGDCPIARSVETADPGEVVAMPMVGGLHHRYTKRAA